MAGLKNITSVWQNIKEIDLKPIRDSALHEVRIVLVGELGTGRHTLAEQMRTDPARPGVHTQSPIAILPVDPAAVAPVAHLIIMMVDATRTEFSQEQSLARKWSEAGKNVLVFFNKIDLITSGMVGDPWQGWQASKVLYGSVNDVTYLQREFIPALLELLPQQHLALGRQFPLFRLPIARQLINDTCFSNAAYSFSTGVVEIVPVLDLPLNVTDMIVLTKTQAFLAYKLGLLLGFSTRWQDYVTEFGSVIGGGFLWRQLARQLIGLIPAWGIIPKVAVSYSGTYVVGNAILGWYLTGRNLSPKQMRALSVQAFARGKDYAKKLAERIPRPRRSKRKTGKLPAPESLPELASGSLKTSQAEMPIEGIVATQELAAGNPEAVAPTAISVEPASTEKVTPVEKPHRPEKRRLGWRKQKEQNKVINTRVCSHCGKTSSADASFCQYCGNHF
jgi:uncharacterized protein (DUF697 family)